MTPDMQMTLHEAAQSAAAAWNDVRRAHKEAIVAEPLLELLMEECLELSVQLSRKLNAISIAAKGGTI